MSASLGARVLCILDIFLDDGLLLVSFFNLFICLTDHFLLPRVYFMIFYENTSSLKICLYLFHVVASVKSDSHSSMARIYSSKIILIEICLNYMSCASQFLQSYGINTLGDVTKVNIQNLWSVFNGFFLTSCMTIDISAIKHIQIGRQELLFRFFRDVGYSLGLGSRSSYSLRSHLGRFVVDWISHVWLIFDLPVELALSHVGGRIPVIIQSRSKKILFVI